MPYYSNYWQSPKAEEYSLIYDFHSRKIRQLWEYSVTWNHGFEFDVFASVALVVAKTF